MNKPYMIDLFQGDDVSDAGGPLAGLDRVKADGIAFLYHKASEAQGLKDSRCLSRFDHWMVDAKPVTVHDVDGAVLQIMPKFGYYHFNGTMANSAIIAGEVRNFLGAISPRWEKGQAVCADWENIGASGYAVPAVQMDQFCQQVEQRLGISCDVYGGNVPREAFQHSVPSSVIDRFTKRRFWFCLYANYNPNLLPLPWRHVGPTWVQDDGDKYGPGPHMIPGIIGYCDNSTVVGTMTVARAAETWGQ